jgi:hypothetical protein
MIEHVLYFLLRFVWAIFGLILIGVIGKTFVFIIPLNLSQISEVIFNPVHELIWFFIGLGVFFSLRSFINFIHKKRNNGLSHQPMEFMKTDKNQNVAYGSSDAFSTRPFLRR